MVPFEYQWIKSKRKTFAIQIDKRGNLIVRTPKNVTKAQVEVLLEKHKEWIGKKMQDFEKKTEQGQSEEITDEMRSVGKRLAKVYFQNWTAHYAKLMGVDYGKITIREQKTRWGSCSSAGNLNFNWKLMLMPKEVVDYVIVHELAHRKEMNHSKAFWKIVETYMPDYEERKKKLGNIDHENGIYYKVKRRYEDGKHEKKLH